MFVNNLTDVKDSTFNHVFVGSDDVLKKRGMMDSLSCDFECCKKI